MHCSLIIIVLLCVAGQFSLVPSSVTSYFGRLVQFTCGVEAPGILTWEVDGIEARYLHTRNITFYTETAVDAETSTLSIAATTTNNNSEIICISSFINGQEIARTPSVFLYVQGVV